MVTGVALTGLGAALLGAGVVLLAIPTSLPSGCAGNVCSAAAFAAADSAANAHATRQTAGITVLAAGVAVLGAGIPLWIVGARRLAVRQALPAPPEARVPELRVGLGTASLRLAF